MIYVMMIVWCFFIYATGRGLYRMWASVAGGAVVDWLMLPATLLSELLYSGGWLMLPATLLSELLYSGGRLMTGRPVFAGIIAPQNAASDPCRVAISGKNGFLVEMLSAALAMAGAWIAMLLLCKELSGCTIASINSWGFFTSYSSLPKTFPASWADMWDQMIYFCRLTQRTGDVLASQDYTGWEMPAFVYGSIVLAVRLGPVRHDLRATLAVMGVLVGLVALASAISPDFRGFANQELWYMLTYIFGLLLLLLCCTLVVGGVVKLVVIFLNKGQGHAPKSSDEE